MSDLDAMPLTPENVARVLDEMAAGQRTEASFTFVITRQLLERVRPGPAMLVTWADQLRRAEGL